VTDCTETRRPTRQERRVALHDLMLRASETDRRTRELVASTAATLERLRLLQELKRRRRL
jgi:hypothetical protein